MTYVWVAGLSDIIVPELFYFVLEQSPMFSGQEANPQLMNMASVVIFRVCQCTERGCSDIVLFVASLLH